MLKIFPFEKRDPDRDNVEFADLEYKFMDFYCPYVNFVVERNNKIQEIMVTPVSLAIETAEVSMTDFNLLVKAALEIYDLLGEYYLKTDLFIAKIDSRNVEDIILGELKKLRLF